MEVYYKDLISEEASLEKLVDDLALIVQGAGEFVEAAAVELPEERKAELKSRLQRLKERCLQIKQQTMAGARAADRAMRLHPYSAMGVAFAAGLLASTLLRRRK